MSIVVKPSEALDRIASSFRWWSGMSRISQQSEEKEGKGKRRKDRPTAINIQLRLEIPSMWMRGQTKIQRMEKKKGIGPMLAK